MLEPLEAVKSKVKVFKILIDPICCLLSRFASRKCFNSYDPSKSIFVSTIVRLEIGEVRISDTTFSTKILTIVSRSAD